MAINDRRIGVFVVAVALLGAAACSGSEAVVRYEQIVAEACACEDFGCALSAIEKTDHYTPPRRMTNADHDRALRATARLAECVERLRPSFEPSLAAR